MFEAGTKVMYRPFARGNPSSQTAMRGVVAGIGNSRICVRVRSFTGRVFYTRTMAENLKLGWDGDGGGGDLHVVGGVQCEAS